MKMISRQAVLFAALSAASLSAFAGPNIGYAYDSRDVLVRDGYGECVRTAEWTPAIALKECDPSLFKAEVAPVVAAPVAAPVVAAPAPAPVVAPMPVKVELSADELFDFGKSDLKPGAQGALNKLAADLNGVNFDKVTITGHTDHIGSAANNQKLSEARALSVKSYLVSKGISADKIATIGRGSSERVTQPEGKNLKGAKLHDYLAADRRVSIRVAGTRVK